MSAVAGDIGEHFVERDLAAMFGSATAVWGGYGNAAAAPGSLRARS